MISQRTIGAIVILVATTLTLVFPRACELTLESSDFDADPPAWADRRLFLPTIESSGSYGRE